MKERTLGDFIFSSLNQFGQKLGRALLTTTPFNIDRNFICDGCGKHFGLDELFRNDEIKEWLCDDCLKKKEE